MNPYRDRKHSLGSGSGSATSTGEPSTPNVAQELVASLLDPRSYPHAPTEVTLVQTHISLVFLAGTEVFKLKKAVRFSFLDFSTLERRRHFCEEEVRLNRRLAPGVYLGVVPITRVGNDYRVGGPGEPVEYAVHMRRLPTNLSLRALVERGEADDALMQRIAEKMAAFHAQADTSPEITANGNVEALLGTVDENFTNLEPFAEWMDDDANLEDLRELLPSAIARVSDRLRQRQRAGRVRDCHGDLRPDHVCCAEALPIFDCIEFNSRFRHCDVASEMAFLAMELEFLGAPMLAKALIEHYIEASGDTDLSDVLPVFRAYRAQVRAMVSGLTSREQEIEPAARERCRDEARRYLALAARSAWSGHAPLILAMAGISGTGKSTVAAALTDRTGFAWVRSDLVRKRMAGLASFDRPATPAAAAELYAPTRSAAVYETLTGEADALTRAGHGVVIDATFQRRADRERVRQTAARTGARLFWLECRAPLETVRERLALRARRRDDPSDATWAVAEPQARDFEPLDEVPPSEHLILETGRGTDAAREARRRLVQRLAAAARGVS